MSQHDEARAEHEQQEPIVDQLETVTEATPADDPAKVTLGPLGLFFRREAEFYRQEALNMAIMMEKVQRHGR